MGRRLFYCVSAILGGLLCAGLRLWQLLQGWEPETGLPIAGNLPGLLLPCLLGLLAAMLSVAGLRQHTTRRCADAFSLGSGTMTLLVTGSFVMVGAGAFALYQSLPGGDWQQLLPGVLMLVAGGGYFMAVPAMRRKAHAGTLLLLPVCVCLVLLVLFYLQTASDPVLAHFYPETLALSGLALSGLCLAGYAFGDGRDRLYCPLTALTVILCATATMSLQPPLTLYLAGGGLVQLGFLLAWRPQW